MQLRYLWIAIVAAVMCAALCGCSSTKHVPQGQLLVDKVTIDVEPGSGIKGADLTNYLRQSPNHKVLGAVKLQLATYSLSGLDSTKWYNRWLQRAGQAPVIYDPELTRASQRQLQLAMINRGYLDAVVTFDTVARPEKKKIEVTYHVSPGPGHRIANVSYEIPDSAIAAIISSDTARFSPKAGDLLDLNRLDQLRGDITSELHNRGYYAFTKDYIGFYADTVPGSTLIDLTLSVKPPVRHGATQTDTIQRRHTRYFIDKVYFVTDYQPGETTAQMLASAQSRQECKGITVLYGADRYIKASALVEKCSLLPGDLYKESNVNRTYEMLAQMSILKTVNISIVPLPAKTPEGEAMIDIFILLQRNRKQSVTLELEGTNSEGDLGVGAGVTYQHRNLGHRSEMLTAKLRVNYESISGNLEGFINDRYTEYAGEIGITFPKFMAPLLSASYRRRVKATTEFALSFNYQERPEYTRIISGAAWKYKWHNRNATVRRNLDLIDINYVYLPKSTIDFISQIAPDNPLLRYSYEDHFIMRMGYNFYSTNKLTPQPGSTRLTTLQPVVRTFRASVEIAGNLLYGISKAIGQHKTDGAYMIFGVPYSQYAKAEADFTWTRNINPRHSVALHAGLGVAYPYGNSAAVPFEKRFYAGGANGVRGWAVRTLGPGSYDSRNSVTSFINQCGDISLILNAEYRCKLFWVLEGALFVDAGNVWTIKEYENQPGGLFRFDSFYKEIAAAYGIGLRLDFTYFLFRLDLGMKAYNPAANQQPWPLTHPNWHRDATIHFSVGYPF